MRVLHLNDRLSERGGADWYLIGLAHEQVERGHDVSLLVGRDDGTAEVTCAVERVAALQSPTRRPAVEALDRVVDRLAPDVVHVHNVMNPDALDWAAGRGAVMTVQDHRSFCPGRGKLTATGERCDTVMSQAACAACFDDADYFERIAAVTSERLAAVRRMARVVVLSDYMRRELVAVGVEPDRVTIIPPFVTGLDLDAEPSGPPCVLFAGRLVTAKGVWDAAAAWERAEVDVPLVFCGTGSERQALEQAGFEVTGWVPHDEMSGIYRRARALLLTSRWQEPFGIVGLEALAMGVPVIAWDSGGVHEWISDVVAWGDVDALARQLTRLGRDDSPGATRTFDVDDLMMELHAVYDQL